MLNTKYSPWPSYAKDEGEAVQEVLLSNKVNYWTGNHGRMFESEFASWADCRHAVAVSNGTVALDLALKGLGIDHGDEVIVTPRTFIASVSSVVNIGAIPIFADVDPESGNISEKTIEEVITPKTRAIVPVHLAGWPCDMTSIMALAAKHGLLVIEDCAQAHGAKIDSQSAGSFGQVAAWSFCQDKIMTTGGEGGMVTTNDKSLWSEMWSFKDHGKSWDAVYNRDHPPGYRWLHESFGTNWRMLEMQAVIGRIQLKRMSEWTKRRTYIASRIREVLLSYKELRCPVPEDRLSHAYYRQYGYLRADADAGTIRDRIVAEAQKKGTPIFQGSCSEVYNEKAFDDSGWRPKAPLPIAKNLGESSLMFLTHPTLADAEVERYVDEIDQALNTILS